MAQTAWRCEHPTTGDVKYAARYDHVLKLEAKDYVCVLDPDLDMDEIQVWMPVQDE